MRGMGQTLRDLPWELVKMQNLEFLLDLNLFLKDLYVIHMT